MTKSVKLSALALFLALFAPFASAQPYPNKPIRLVTNFPAGGLADAVCRAIAQPLSLQIGQPVVVDNRTGADGAIAGEFVAKSAPDGYTLFFGTNSAMVVVPVIRKTPPYDPLADFTPVSMIGRFPFFVFAHPSLPARNLAELVEYARANPGKLNYGTGNTTSIISTGTIATLARLQMQHVPYKGDAPLMNDLVSGRLHFAVASTSPGGPLAKDGKLKVLGTLSPRRNPLFPDAPTMAESGFASYTLVSWGAIFGPANLPRDIVERLAKEFNAVIQKPEVIGPMDRYGFELQGSSPAEMVAYLKEQAESWRRGVRDAGITPD